jgi:hypothetical protein
MKCVSTIAVLLAFTSAVFAAPAKEVLNDTIAAMGGIDRLRGVQSLSYSSAEHTFLHRVELSESLPQLIIYENHEVLLQPKSLNLSEKTNWRWTESAAQTNTQLTVSPQGGFTESNSKKHAITADEFYKVVDTLAANPIVALLGAADAADLTVSQSSDETNAISFHQPVYGQTVKTTLGINKQTHLPQWIEIEHSVSQNVFDAFWGPRPKRFVLSAWSIDAGGIHFPLKRQTVVQGRVEGQESLYDLKINPEVAATNFTIPDEFHNSFESILHASADDLAKGNHGDGNHLDVQAGIVMLPGKNGAYNSLLVKQDRGIVVIEGPYSNANSDYVITYAKTAFPGSPISSVVTTDQLQFHLGGLPAYAKAHIPIYVLDANAGLVRNYLTTQSTEDPVRESDLQLRTVRGRTEIGTGPNRIVLIPFRGTASVRMLAVYLPEQKLLYCSDMYLPQVWEPKYYTEHLSEIRDLISRERIDVVQVSGVSMVPHNWKEISASIPG